MNFQMRKIYQRDLETFLRFYEQTSICPYYFCEKEEINKAITEYINKHEIASDPSFVYFFRYMLKRLVGELDSHSMIRTRHEYERLPLKIVPSNSGFVVKATNEKYANYLDKTVTKINDIPLEKLASEAENAISYSVNGYLELETNRFLSHCDPLRTLPSIDDNAQWIVYTFSDGEEVKVRVGGMGFAEPSKPNNYDIEVNEQHLLLYYASCREDHPKQMYETVDKIKGIISEQGITCFTLDLRGNTGGNDRIIRPLVDLLKSCPSLRKQVFVDHAVQSAALFALNDMKNLGAEVFGTGIGSSMNHIGNNCRFELPSGRFLTIVATRYFYIDESGNFVTVRTQEEFRKLDKKYVAPRYVRIESMSKAE